MFVPKQKSVQLVKKIAKEIVKIKIEAETFFNFDANYKNSNSVDRNFMQNLKDKADLFTMNSLRVLVIVLPLFISLPVMAVDEYSSLGTINTTPKTATIDEVKWSGLTKAPTIDEIHNYIEKQPKYNKGTLWDRVHKSSNQRDYSCVKAFGHVGFCKCLGKELPVFLTLPGYVAIIAGNDKYIPKMKKEERYRYYKKVVEIRDSCVNKSHKG